MSVCIGGNGCAISGTCATHSYFYIALCYALPGASVEKSLLGGYTVQEHVTPGSSLPHPTLVLAGSGTELALALQVAKQLFDASAAAGTR